MKLRNLTITSLLAVSGVALWSYGAMKLAEGGQFDYRPNPLGLKESPYGQVIALAVQGEIDSDWHGADIAGNGHICTECGHDHGAQGDANCTETPQERGAEPKTLIAKLEQATSERTNGRPPTPGHKFYLRRQVEDRLRMAWELDPSNYGNYNSYQLFLTEPSVGTRPVLTDTVKKVAERTIKYCLEETSDPRPALTAASAAGNILELMFIHREEEHYTIDQMRSLLKLMDYSISKHHDLKSRWMQSGDLERLSPARIEEMETRLAFVEHMREASDKTIQRLSSTEISSKF
jgi:hypothetical protein